MRICIGSRSELNMRERETEEGRKKGGRKGEGNLGEKQNIL